jgi:hypothetical protein
MTSVLMSEAQEAQQVSMTELFEKDPLELTDEEVDLICQTLREKREEAAQTEAEAKLKGKAPTIKVTLEELALALPTTTKPTEL